MLNHQATDKSAGAANSADLGADRADLAAGPSGEPQNATDWKPSRHSEVRGMILHARLEADKPFWPLGLCIAWLARQDTTKAVKLFARRNAGIQYDLYEWARARTKLVNDLAGGHVQAWGLPSAGGKRVQIPGVEWLDLRIRHRGSFDDVLNADGSFAYHRARVFAAQMIGRRPSEPAQTIPSAIEVSARVDSEPQTGQASIGDKNAAQAPQLAEASVPGVTERPASSEISAPQARSETPAAKRARAKLGDEKSCQLTLIKIMKSAPESPTRKFDLWKGFPDLSNRAFKRAFTEAAADADCPAWRTGGRRRRKD